MGRQDKGLYNKDIVKRLKNANSHEDIKWLYNLCAWCYAHPNATPQQIRVRINISHMVNRGYFKKFYYRNAEESRKNQRDKYKDRDKGKYNKYYRNYKKKHADIFKAFQEGKLSRRSSNKIRKILEDENE